MKLPYTGYLQQPVGIPVLYYITDRRLFAGTPEEQRRQLLRKVSECASAGVDYIQLREKGLSIRALEDLARDVIQLLSPQNRTRLLINSRTDVALACGAHGVHLPANDLPPSEVRAIFGRTGDIRAMIGASTHSTAEVSYAEAHGADFAVFGPVFEKNGATTRHGVEGLRQACQRPDRSMPVLAIGGVTLENAQSCIAAGASGIAAIRMFQEADVAKTVHNLRRIQVP